MNISTFIALGIVVLAAWYLWRRFAKRSSTCDCPGCSCADQDSCQAQSHSLLDMDDPPAKPEEKQDNEP